jgi:hypothetical protein
MRLDAGDVDDGAARRHMRNDASDQPDHVPEVLQPEHLLRAVRHVDKAREEGAARVVHENVDSAVSLDDFREEGFDRVGVAHVDNLCDVRVDHVESFSHPVAHRDTRTESRKELSGRPSQAPAGTRDDRDLVAQQDR